MEPPRAFCGWSRLREFGWGKKRKVGLLICEKRPAPPPLCPCGVVDARTKKKAPRITRITPCALFGPLPGAMLPSDTSTVSAPKGAPPPGRPQRKVSTKVPEASVRTESGTAEPKLDNIRSLFTTHKTHNFPCI